MIVIDILILIFIVSYILYKLNRSGLLNQQNNQSSSKKDSKVVTEVRKEDGKKTIKTSDKKLKTIATKFVEECTKDTGDILGDLQDEYHRSPNPDGPQHKYVDYSKPGNNPFEL